MQRPDDGLNLVRALLARALAALPLSPRQIEDSLQIGHGTLPRLLDGRMDLKLHHLLPLCGVLKIHPADLLRQGLPGWEAEHQIDDWLPPDHRGKAARPSGLSDEILEAIRAAVREEVSRVGQASGAEPQKPGRNR
jgi:DNA-binding Xre family transcriptional regulator